jgi:hypothetical protein
LGGSEGDGDGDGDNPPINTCAMPPAAPEKRSFAVCMLEDGPSPSWASMSAAESAMAVSRLLGTGTLAGHFGGLWEEL